MRIIVKQIQSTDTIAWDRYVHAHHQATLYHLSGWKNIIEKTYAHKTYYLIAQQQTFTPLNAKPNPLHWHYISIKGKSADTETSEKSKFEKAINLWQKLPVSVTKIIGPMIRKHIEL